MPGCQGARVPEQRGAGASGCRGGMPERQVAGAAGRRGAVPGRRSKKSDDRWENATKRPPHHGSIVRGSRLAKAASGLRLA